MKKLSVCFIILSSLLFIARFNNPPDGRTGAPGESTCASGGCHNSSGANHTANVSISGFPGTLDAGQTYTISFTASHGGTIPASPRLGFQLVALDENDINVGTLSNPSPSATITTSGGRTYAEHNPGLNSSNNTWTVDFTSPSTGSSSMVTIYAVANVANGNGNSSGDLIETTTMSANLTPGSDPLSATVSKINDVSCSGGSDGSAEVIAMGGATMNYEYEWDNGEITAIAINLDAGLHEVTVTDDTEEVIESVLIEEPDALIVELVEKNNPSCHDLADGSIEVSVEGGTSPYDYRWSNGGSGNPLSGLGPGTYIVTVSDDNDCEMTFEETLVAPDPIEISFVEVENPSCSGMMDGSILIETMGGTGQIRVEWSSGQDTEFIGSLDEGLYIVTATDENDCTAEAEIELIAPNGMTIEWEVQEILCFGEETGMISIEVMGGEPDYEYEWSNGDTDSSIDNLSADAYFVTVTDQNGCSVMGDTTLTEPEEIIVSSNSSDPTCFDSNNGSISLIPSGGTEPYTYQWGNGSSDSSRMDLGAGVYRYTVSDVNQCEVTDSVTLIAPDLITYDLSSQNETAENAEDGSARVDNIMGGTAPYSVQWSTGSTQNQIGMLAPGTYYVEIMDDNGCTVRDSVQIREFGCDLLVSYSSESPKCFDSCDGFISFDIEAGTQPFQIMWSENLDSAAVCAGQYGLTITDATGCSDSMSFNLINPDPIVITIDSVLPDMSDSPGSGAVYTTASGGTGMLTGTILLNGTQNVATADASDDFIDLDGGMYVVRFEDENACVTESMMIEVPIEVDVHEEQLSNAVIFPIPAKDKVYVKGLTGLSVKDIKFIGSDLRETDADFSLNGAVYEIDVRSKKEGFYLVIIELDNGERLIRKMLK